MFAVDNILISDDVVDAPFACNLGACLGACCVQGDSGAPLEDHERAEVEAVLPIVRHRLRPEALKVIDRDGVWENNGSGDPATTCVDGAECVFVVYEGPVAKCSIQQAHYEGKTDFPKPISCHLYPIRVEDLGDFEALNYERLDMCAPAIKRGKRESLPLFMFLKEPLVRKYGADWYDRFEAACIERREILSGAV